MTANTAATATTTIQPSCGLVAITMTTPPMARIGA